MKSAKEWLDELPPEPIRPCMAQEWTDWSHAAIRYCEAIQRDALEAAAKLCLEFGEHVPDMLEKTKVLQALSIVASFIRAEAP